MSLKVKLAQLELQNPIILASGTFDRTLADKIDISKLGGLVTKTITLEPREGNPLPHIIKTKYGFINSVGLKNPGVKKYLADELPFWQKLNPCVIPSIGGESIEEYIKLADIFESKKIKTIEVNISCPNVDKGGLAFGLDEQVVNSLVKKVCQKFSGILIVKLSPNITDVSSIAKAALDGGADAVSLVNTFLAMEIDNRKRQAKLSRKIGGYSGSAIKPMALRMVWEVYRKLKCPIIGGGGIENFDDALDFLMVGATAIFIGSANYLNPRISIDIIDRLENYVKENKIDSLEKIRGII